MKKTLGAGQQVVLTLMILGGARLLASGIDSARVVVVYTSGVPAYAEAIDGIRAVMKDASVPIAAIDLNSPNHEVTLQQIRSNPNLVVLAVGADALQEVSLLKPAAPVVSSMVLQESETPQGGPSPGFHAAASVHLDVAIPALLAELSNLFPGKSRLGVIRNPVRAWQFDGGAAAKARQQGFTVRMVECARPEELLPAFLSLRGNADFVLVLPDSTVYNSATVKPFILASLENRLPIIGFSASFVRSGAAIGIYPDFRDIGQQTAELAVSLLSKRLSHPVDEGPRKWMIAINQRAMRLLGLEHGSPRNAELVMFR